MIPNWRRRCRKAACFITEVWSDMLPEYLLELLSQFDHALGMRNAVEDVGRMIGRPCSYLPLAVDVPRFAPASMNEPRPDRRLQHRPTFTGNDIKRCSRISSGVRASTTLTPSPRAAATAGRQPHSGSTTRNCTAESRHCGSAAGTTLPIATTSTSRSLPRGARSFWHAFTRARRRHGHDRRSAAHGRFRASV